MKVVLVSDEIIPFSIGGVATYTYNLAKYLSKNEDLEITVITQGNKDFDFPFPVRVINCKRLYNKMSPFDLKACYQVYKAIKKERPDIVHSTDTWSYMSWFGNFYARHKKIPTVISHHSIYFPNSILEEFFYRSIFIKNLEKVGRVIVPGKKSAESLKRVMQNKDILRIVPHGVEQNLELDKNFSIRELYDIDYNDFLIVSAMRIEERKDPWTLCKGFCKLKENIQNSKLVIIGDGAKAHKLKKRIEKENDVYLAGKLPHSFTLKAMKEADVVALTSEIESFGLVPLEAMSVGTPVVCTNVGEIPEIIKNEENGLLVPVRDAEALANAFLRIYEDRNLAKRLIKNGLKTVKKFSCEKTAKKTYEVYLEVLEEHNFYKI